MRGALRAFDKLCIFGDSKLILSQVSKRAKCNAPNLVPLWDQASTLLKEFKDVKYQHIPRAENAIADYLSNRAVQSQKKREHYRFLQPGLKISLDYLRKKDLFNF